MVEVIGVVKDETPDVTVLFASGASFCLEVSAGRTVPLYHSSPLVLEAGVAPCDRHSAGRGLDTLGEYRISACPTSSEDYGGAHQWWAVA